MPCKITWLERTVVVDFFEAVSIQEVRKQGLKINADPRAHTISKRILNCSRVESLEASAADLKIFAYIDKEAASNNTEIHLAVVGNSEKIKANTAGYKDAIGSAIGQVELFASIGEALAWDPESKP